MRTQLAMLVVAASSYACAAPPKVVAFEPLTLAGYAGVEPQQFDAPTLTGTITAVTSKTTDDQAQWELTLEVQGKPHAYAFTLPAKLAPALAKGATVTIDARLAGGGPNTRGQIAIADDAGPIVAIDLMPAPWTAERGSRVAIDRGSPYDSTTFAVLVRAPQSDPAALVEAWRSFSLAGHHYVGTGNAVRRDLHGNAPPPDYVGSWVDFAIVRTDP